MVSLAFTQSQLLAKEVYLIDRIDMPQNRDKMKHLKCLCFLRPHNESFKQLFQELSDPHYGSYYLCM